MMDGLIAHNDRILPLREACLSPGQIGLLMGWGVFTTLRLYEGVPFQFRRHWERMARDAARLDVPMAGDAGAVRAQVIELARANRRPEGMARLVVVRNGDGAWAGNEGLGPADLLIFTSAVPSWPSAHRLCLQPNAVFSHGPFAGAKMLSWAANSIFLERARTAGFDDAALLNDQGFLAECTSANLFLVRGNKVLTPPLDSGCLPGITREILIEIAPGAGVELREAELAPADLDAASEVFISSTTREVAPVSHVSPKWDYPAPGRITTQLEAAFRDYLRSHRDEA